MECTDCMHTPPEPIVLFQGARWHIVRAGNGLALVADRHVEAWHDVSPEEWSELQWLLPHIVAVAKALTNAPVESIESSPSAGFAHIYLRVAVEGEIDAVAALQLLQKRIEQEQVLRVDSELRLRAPKVVDASTLADNLDANRDYLRRFLFWVDYNRTPEDSRRFILDCHRKREQGTGYSFVIEHHGTIIGTCGLVNVYPLHRRAEIGYWIDESQQGQGIVSRCAERLIEWAFSDLKLCRIDLLTHPKNTKSIALAKRLHFVHEGRIRKAMQVNGQMVDLEVYGRLHPKET